jgi:hypothetical protein
MDSVQLKPASISLTRMRNSVLVYGTICSAIYIAFLLVMKLFGLMHITELRFVNYVILCMVGLYQIKQWIKQTGAYVPFLQVLATVFFTGVWSFILFSVFLFAYTRYDAELADLFVQRTRGVFPVVPSIVILFEGAASSIIVAFINMQYFRRYEEGEKSPRS